LAQRLLARAAKHEVLAERLEHDAHREEALLVVVHDEHVHAFFRLHAHGARPPGERLRFDRRRSAVGTTARRVPTWGRAAMRWVSILSGRTAAARRRRAWRCSRRRRRRCTWRGRLASPWR